MAENDKDTREENIQQNPDHVEDEKKKPVTPEPPQRKHPQAKPDAEDTGKRKG